MGGSGSSITAASLKIQNMRASTNSGWRAVQDAKLEVFQRMQERKEQWQSLNPGGYYIESNSLWSADLLSDYFNSNIVNAGWPGSSSVMVLSNPGHQRGLFTRCISEKRPHSNERYRGAKEGAGRDLHVVVELNGEQVVRYPDSGLNWLPKVGESRPDIPYLSDKSYPVRNEATVYDDTLGCNVSTAIVEQDSGHQQVVHLSYLHWPDMGVPTAQDEVRLRNLVTHVARLRSKNPASLTHVNCSAGLGRSGTFAGLLLQHEAKAATGEKLDTVQLVNDMRECRRHLVWNETQFDLLERASHW